MLGSFKMFVILKKERKERTTKWAEKRKLKPSFRWANVTADNIHHASRLPSPPSFPPGAGRPPRLLSSALLLASLSFPSPPPAKQSRPTPRPARTGIATGGSQASSQRRIDSAARPPVHGSGGGGGRAGGVAAVDVAPAAGAEPAADLGDALPRRLRRAALLLLVPAGLRPRLVLLRLLGLGVRGARLARRALRLRHVRRRVRPALHGRRARRRRARHARHLDHRTRAPRLRGPPAQVARRRGPPRHQGHRGPRAPRPPARGQRRRRALRRRQLRRAPPRTPRRRRRPPRFLISRPLLLELDLFAAAATTVLEEKNIGLSGGSHLNKMGMHLWSSSLDPAIADEIVPS